MNFYDILQKRTLILDGATGTELVKEGMPTGVCPELWVYENPDSIQRVQRRYVEAGSDLVYSCTFGGNRLKLQQFGLEERVAELNSGLARISKEAVGEKLVFGDLAPTGKFFEPFGEFPFDLAIDVYAEQAKALADGGVDGFVIETMMDIQEVRAALIAVKSVSSLPVIVTMTFEADGRSLNGTPVLAALDIVQSLGAAAFGCNCSTGPKEMLALIKSISPYAHIPLIAKPNAGLPKLIDGETVFDMGAEEFGAFANSFISSGVSLAGGCCGTTPEHIASLCASLNSRKSSNRRDEALLLSHAKKSAIVGSGHPTLIVDRANDDSSIFEINAETLLATIKEVSIAKQAIPCVPETAGVAQALKLFPGKALFEASSIEAAFSFLASNERYGAACLLRLSLRDQLDALFADESLDEFRSRLLILVKPDLFSMFSIELKEKLFSLVWGLEFIEESRPALYHNLYLLAEASKYGASIIYGEKLDQELHNFAVSYDALLGKDCKLTALMSHFTSLSQSESEKKDSVKYNPVYEAVLIGSESTIESAIKSELEKGAAAKELVDEHLIPAINEVGLRYEKKEYFLPQLIMSADTMSRGFEVLEPYLADSATHTKKDGVVVIATVKGDIHDIGKNIVTLMLKNYNFDVIDLGKDVDEHTIAAKVKEHKADIVALSALMTTTMTEMETVVNHLKREKISVKVMIGGAVVDAEYADKIGADGYSSDAMEAVKLAQSLVAK